MLAAGSIAKPPVSLRGPCAALALLGGIAAAASLREAGASPSVDRDGALAVLAVALAAGALAIGRRGPVVGAVVALLVGGVSLALPLAAGAAPGEFALRLPFAALCALAALAVGLRLSSHPLAADGAAILAGLAAAVVAARVAASLVGDPGAAAFWPVLHLFIAPAALVPLLAWPAWEARRRRDGFPTALAHLLAFVAMGIAGLALLGHAIGSSMLTTGIGRNPLPVQTALATIVTALLLRAAADRDRSRFMWAALIAAFALLSLATVVLPAATGPLQGSVLPPEGVEPGRALFGGMFFLLVAIAALAASRESPRVRDIRFAQGAGLAAAATGAIGVSGVVAEAIYGVDPMLGANQLSFFGLFALACTGAALFTVATSRADSRRRRTEAAPAAIAVAALALTVSLWGGATRQAEDAIMATGDVALEALKRTLAAELDSRNRDLSRLAAQLAADGPEARMVRMGAAGRALSQRYRTLSRLSWVPDAGDPTVYDVVRGTLVEPAIETSGWSDASLEGRLLRRAARDQSSAFGAAIDDAGRGRQLAQAEVGRAPDGRRGTLLALFSIEDPVLPLLVGSPVPGYGASIVLDSVPFGVLGSASRPGAGDALARFVRSDATPVWGMSLRISVWPLAGTVERLRSRLPEAILVGGVLISGLLGIITVLAGAARERARVAQVAQRAAEESQREIAELLEGLPDAFFAYDRQWRFTHINRAAGALVKRPRQALIGTLLWDSTPRAREYFAQPFERVMQRRTVERFEFFYAETGVWLAVQVFPLPDGIGAVARDVTREHEVLRTLRRSEADLAQALEIADLARLEMTADERVSWSGAASRVLGCAPEDLPMDRGAVRRFWHPDDAAMLAQQVDHGIASGHGYDVEYRIVWRDGSVRWVHTVARVLPDGPGAPRVVATVQDITERKLQARAVLERDRFFEGSRDLFCIISRDGRFVQVNPALCRAFGVPREGLIGRLVFDFTVDEDRKASRDRFAAVLGGVPGRASVFRIRNADGRVRSVHWTSTLSADGDVYAVGHDVTDRLAAELERERNLAELQARNEELQQFAYIASHDLQEPLRKIQAFGDRLRGRYAEVLDADGRDYLARMDNAARRMSTLIADLLEYSRVATRGAPFAAVPLDDVLDDVLGDLEESIHAAGAEVLRGPLPVIEADRTQMAQLLQNLIGNALKYRHPSRAPRVEVRAEGIDGPAAAPGATPEAWLRLVVSDNGIGFDPAHRERIFAPFQRLHGRAEYAGTGIGLAIVRKIVERHGGRVAADGRPGAGAAFTAELPLRQP